jgi:tRNA A-37 threonylcarbamoyl transferase component Bud32
MPFIVMVLIERHALSTRQDRLGEATFAPEVVCQVAAGLAALHRAGIVHRDLKPATVAHAVAKIDPMFVVRTRAPDRHREAGVTAA